MDALKPLCARMTCILDWFYLAMKIQNISLPESLKKNYSISRRCKGQQHMRWSREGLNPLLQLRAAINSKNDWSKKWKMAVLNVA